MALYQSLASETHDPYGQEYLAPGTISSLAKIYAPSMNRDAAVRTLLAVGGRQADIDAAIQGLYFQGETPPAASPTGALSTATTAPAGYNVFGLNWNPTADLATKQGYIKTLLGQNVTPEQLKTRIAEFDPASATQEAYTALGIPAGTTPTSSTVGALTQATSPATNATNINNDPFYDLVLKMNWGRESAGDIGLGNDPRFKGGEVYVDPITGSYLSRDEYLRTANTPEALEYQQEQNRLAGLANTYKSVGSQAASLIDPTSTGGAWGTEPGKSSGPGFGFEGMLNQIGQRIVERTGITDLSQLGARQVPVEGYYRTVSGGEGGDFEEYVPASTKTEFFDKATGQTLDWDGSLGGWGQGPGVTNAFVTSDPSGNIKIKTVGEDSTDPFVKAAAKAGPILNIANVLTGGALTPLTMAVNGINAVASGDPLAIAASAVGAGGYTGFIDPTMASNITTGINAYKAVESGNVVGALATLAGSSFGSDIGKIDLGGGFTVSDAVNAVSAVDRAAKGDIAGALTMAGKAIDSPDLQTAGSALNFVNALESGNLNAIASAGQGLITNVNQSVTNSQVGQLLVNSAGIGAIDADAGGITSPLTQLKPPGSPAEDEQIALAQLNEAATNLVSDYVAAKGSMEPTDLAEALSRLTDPYGKPLQPSEVNRLVGAAQTQLDTQLRNDKVQSDTLSILGDYTGLNSDLSRESAYERLVSAGNSGERANEILNSVDTQVEANRAARATTAAQNQAAINAGAGEFAGADQRTAIAAGAGEFAGADTARATSEAISSAKTFGEAYAAARQAYGAGATFNWKGKLYSTDTFQENPALGLVAVAGSGRGTATGKTVEQEAALNATAEELRKIDPVARAVLLDSASVDYGAVSPEGNAQGLSQTTADKIVQSLIPVNAIKTAFGMTAEAAGNTAKAIGTVGEALGFDTAKMSDFGRKLENVAQEMYPQALKQSENEVKARFASAKSGADLATAIKDSVFNNFGAVAKMIGVEGIQELPNIALAVATGGAYGAVRYAGLLAGLGLDVIESAGLQGAQKVDEGLAKGLSRTAAVKSAVDDMRTAGVTTALMTAAADKIPFGGTIAKTIIKGSASEGAEEYVIARATGADHMTALRQAAFGAMIGGPTEASLQGAGNLTSVVINGDAMVGTYADGTKVTITEPSGATELKIDVTTPSVVAGNVTSTLTSDLTSGVDLNTAINNVVTVNAGSDLSGTIDSTVKVLADSNVDLTQGVSDLTSAAASTTGDTTTVVNQVVSSLASNNVDLNANAGSVVTGAVAGGSSVTTAVKDTLAAITNNGGTASGAATSIIDAVSNQTNGDASAVTDAASTIIASSNGDKATTVTAITAAANATGGSAEVVSSLVADAAKTGNADTAATAVDAAITATNGAALDATVTSALNNGASAETVLSTAANTLIATSNDTAAAVTNVLNAATSNNVDANAAVSSVVTGAVAGGGDTNTVVTAAVDTVIAQGGDVNAAASTAVDSVVKAGGDTDAAVTAAVDSVVKAGGDVNAAVNGAVTAVVNSNGDVNAGVTGAVTAAVGAGVDADTAITTAVDTVIKAGGDVNAAVTGAVTAAVDAGVDANAAVTSAVTSAVASGGDTNTAVSSAVTSAVTSGTDAAAAITSGVTAAIDAGAATDAAVSGAIDGAVSAGVNTNDATSASVNTAIVNAVVSGNDANTSITDAVAGAVSSDAATALGGNATLLAATDTALSTAVANGLDTTQAVTSVIDGAVKGGVDTATAISSTVVTAVNQGNDASTIIDAVASLNPNASVNVNTTDTTTTVITQSDDVTSSVTIDNASGATTTVSTSGDTSTKSVSTSSGTVTTQVDANTNASVTTAVDTTNNTTTQTTVNSSTGEVKITVTDTGTGDIIDTETTTIDQLTPEEKTVITVPPISVTAEVAAPTQPVTQPKQPAQPRAPAPSGGTPAGLLGGMSLAGGAVDWLGPQFLKSKERGGYVDPLAEFKALQQQEEQRQLLGQLQPELANVLTERGAMPYYSYGQEPSIDEALGLPSEDSSGYNEESEYEPVFRSGGKVSPLNLQMMYAKGGHTREDFRDGKHVAGPGDGQSDDIPAWLADGEFVFPADVVSALGNGSTKAGTEKLYEMMHSIRDRARSKGPKDLPPPAYKSPLDYLKKGK